MIFDFEILRWRRFGVMFCALWIFVGNLGFGQSYLKRLGDPSKSFRQKIARFSNGNLLIGDSSLEGSSGDGTETIFLTRMDQCGQIIWSNVYEKKDFHFELIDFAINEQDDIYLFGVASDGLRAVLFLLNVDKNGNKKQFKFFESDTPSHSAISMDLKNNKILVFGSILKIGSPRTGFLAVFDDELNLQWAKNLDPFTYEGKAIITNEYEILGRSGAFHYKFDATGTLLWAKQFDFSVDPEPIGGPFEIAGGFLFEAFFENQAFFYKLDNNGELIWQSPLFISSVFPAAVNEQIDSSLVVHFSSATEEQSNDLHRLKLSPSGVILEQKKLDSDFYFNIGSVYHSFFRDEQIHVVGNNDALTEISLEKTDYLIQFDELQAENECFDWLYIDSFFSNNYSLILPDLPVNIEPLEMKVNPKGGLLVYPRESPFYELCGSTVAPDIVTSDTLLDCDQYWQVNLSSSTIEWDDGYMGASRKLEEIGTYRARNIDCENPTVYEYQLDRLQCDCETFLPNVFSPNRDGINDWVKLYSNCQIMEVETTVIDRWGNLIYTSQSNGELWDGSTQGKSAESGVYVVMVNYVLLSDQGGTQKGILVDDVLLIR